MLITGIAPVITEQGLSVSSFKMDAQDAGNVDEVELERLKQVCLSNEKTLVETFGDIMTVTTCDSSFDKITNDCVINCDVSVYELPGTENSDNNDGDDNPDNPNNCYPVPCNDYNDPANQFPDGAGGGGNGGGTGSTPTTTTTDPDFPNKSRSIPIGTTSIKLNEKREVISGVTVITMAPVATQIPQIPTADLGKIISHYNTTTGQNITTLGVQTSINAYNQNGTPLSNDVIEFLINLQETIIMNYPTTANERVQFQGKPWYLDNDGDGYHASVKIANSKPSGNWKSSTLGRDCDDTNPYVNDGKGNCNVKIWILDTDNDGYHAAGTEPVENIESPENNWKATTSLGIDCNDTDATKTTNCEPCTRTCTAEEREAEKTAKTSGTKTVSDCECIKNCNEEEYEDAIRDGKIVFTRKYGWVDNTHAFFDTKRDDPYIGVDNLWKQLKEPPSNSQIYNGYYSVNYKQDVVVLGISIGIERQYLVRPGLNLEQRKSVALAILQNVSTAFESFQSVHPTSNSSFEPADLPSNMINFYRHVEGLTNQQILNVIEPVSIEQSLEVFRLYPCTFASDEYKNRTFGPLRFESPYTSANFGIPNILNTIKPFEIKTVKHFGSANLILLEQKIF